MAATAKDRVREDLHISAYVPSDLKHQLVASARANDRSLSGELRIALVHYLSRPDNGR